MNTTISHLERLEAESIAIMREVVAECDRPVLLYSVGKDSSVLLHLARKAFYPSPIPFPVMHIDTGFKFKEMYDFRDKVCAELGVELIIHRNEKSIAQGMNPFTYGTQLCCKQLKTEALLQALKEHNFNAAIGGARRDEERSRAKERIFSFRDKFGQWNPRMQRPELWSLYNSRVLDDESMRVFPISNWTELDVWEYIAKEKIPLVSLYFAQEREVEERNQQLIPKEGINPNQDPKLTNKICRFRTLGCAPCTGVVLSEATDLNAVVAETTGITLSERSTRVIDHDTDGSMEIKKREITSNE